MNTSKKIPFAYLKYSFKNNDTQFRGQNHSIEYNFPERSTHETVNLKLGSTQIFGYYLGLQSEAFNFSDVADKFLNRDWNFISGLSAQYLLFIFDDNNSELTVISDSTGSFPIYWTVVDDVAHFSPNIDYFEEVLDEVTINKHTALKMVCHLDGFEDETLFSEVAKIPPSCFFTIAKGEIIGLDSYLKELMYTNNKDTVQVFPDFQAFQHAFFSTLEVVISDYLLAINHKKYVSDLSSGFDSSLISYMLNRLNPNSTQCLYVDLPDPFGTQDKNCIHQFVKKHSLTLDTLIENFEVLEKTAFNVTQYPFSFNDYAMDQRLQYMKSKHAAKVNFTGHGGDELFGIPPIKERFFVKPYTKHAKMIEKTLTTTIELFSQKGIDAVTDSTLYEEAMFYPTILAESSITNIQKRFPSYWKNDICLLAPLTDPRMIAVCQRAPGKKDGTPIFQKEFWATVGPIIHTESHFSKNKKESYGDQLNELLMTHKEQVISHLKSSPLINTNLFKFNAYIDQISQGFKNIQQRSSMTNLYWIFVIRLSSYLRYLSTIKKVKI